MTGHYIAIRTAEDDGRYYEGDDYVDYESQSVGERATILRMLRATRAEGPVLDVGCATGGLLSALMSAGYDAIGIEQSQWAVDAANARVGEGKAFQCDAEVDALPAAVARAAPFGAIVMWAVYEHFRDPPAVLARLSALARHGSALLVNTTNAASLSRMLFGRDWEGYYDWTHLGADSVTVSSLTDALSANGWKIESLITHSFWHAGADPDQALFRNLETNDSRFRNFLKSRGLGDFIVCTARKL
jgi:SAM-dependent methyltransferase